MLDVFLEGHVDRRHVQQLDLAFHGFEWQSWLAGRGREHVGLVEIPEHLLRHVKTAASCKNVARCVAVMKDAV